MRRGLAARTQAARKKFALEFMALVAWLYSAVPLSMVVTYYGVPISLTSGRTFGGFLPTDCATSMRVEGPKGLPCSGRRFLVWASQAIGSGGGLHLEDFEGQWARKAALWGFSVGVIVSAYYMVIVAGWLDDREAARKERAAVRDVEARETEKRKLSAGKF